MIKSFSFLLFFTFILILFSSKIYAQDSVRKEITEENAVSFYRNAVGENSILYKGRLYVGFSKIIKGDQFHATDEWQPGAISYQGNLYKNVPMLYDIFRDELVILHRNKFLKIQLLKSEINYFKFLNSSFVNIQEKDSAPSLPFLGIYERVYQGDVSVLIKRRKLIKETIEEMAVIREFEPMSHYFILKDDSYHEVKGKRSVLRVLKEHRKEVRHRLKEEGIKFRKNRELAIVKMVSFYEEAKK